MAEFDPITLLVVLLCSILSGATGILGGAILLAYLLDSFSLSIAMISHGAIQFSLNFFRACFFRQYILVRSIVPFVAGALLAFLLLSSTQFTPNKALAFLCLGLFGIVGCLIRGIPGIGFSRVSEISTAGAAVSSATLISGVGGPVLDTFFASSALNRLEIMGTKSVLQGFGHILKISYFTFSLSETPIDLANYTLIPACVLVALIGTYIGKSFTFRMTEGVFRKIQSSLILVTSLYFINRSANYF